MIHSPMQRVKGSGIATTGVQVTAAAQIQYLALELSYANSVAKKKKRKKKKEKRKEKKENGWCGEWGQLYLKTVLSWHLTWKFFVEA